MGHGERQNRILSVGGSHQRGPETGSATWFGFCFKGSASLLREEQTGMGGVWRGGDQDRESKIPAERLSQ